MNVINNWKIVFLLCLTLGMAPLFPEPHLWVKLKWVFGGSIGMKPMDWFDLFFHGFPFVLLIRFIVIKFKKNNGS